LKILVVHVSRDKLALGDTIRIKKIIETLKVNEFQVQDLRLPLTSDILFNSNDFKEFISNIIPISIDQSVTLSNKLNYIVRCVLVNSASINMLKKTISKNKPDIILAETSLIGYICNRVSRALSIPSFTDVHGLIFAEVRELGNNKWLKIMKLEKDVFENSEKLVVVSKWMKDYIKRKFKIPDENIVVAPNASEPQQAIAKYDWPFKVIYAGSFSYWEKVDDFLEIAKYMDSKMFKFYMAGAGLLKDKLVKRIKIERIPIHYLGYVPREKIYHLFSKMQIGVAPSTRDLARIVASPIKVFDYMASGLPVITPKIGQWGKLIDEENCGIALPDDSIENYIKAVNSLAEEDAWKKKSNNAVIAVKEKYNWKKTLEPLMKVLSSF